MYVIFNNSKNNDNSKIISIPKGIMLNKTCFYINSILISYDKFYVKKLSIRWSFSWYKKADEDVKTDKSIKLKTIVSSNHILTTT
jgi:hypothetical protein